MVEHLDADVVPGIDELAGDFYVFTGWARISARVLC